MRVRWIVASATLTTILAFQTRTYLFHRHPRVLSPQGMWLEDLVRFSRRPEESSFLDRKFPELNCVENRFEDVVNYLAAKTGVSFDVHWAALSEIGIGRDSPCTCRLKDIRLSKLLYVVLKELGQSGSGSVDYAVVDGRIVVSTPQDLFRGARSRVYPIGEVILIGMANMQWWPQTSSSDSFPSPDEPHYRERRLVLLITSTAAPSHWQVNGGFATATCTDGKLCVTATEQDLAEVQQLLIQLHESGSRRLGGWRR